MITPKGNPARVVQRLIDGDYALVSSDAHRDEVRGTTGRIANDPRYAVTERSRQRVLAALANAIQTPADAVSPIRCRDPKDDYLLACAVAGNAHFLVTGDRDLLALDGDPALGALRIVTPLDFLAALDARTAAE